MLQLDTDKIWKDPHDHNNSDSYTYHSLREVNKPEDPPLRKELHTEAWGATSLLHINKECSTL